MKNHKASRELPVDRGWAWVICFASFLCMFLIGTSMQALSVLFLELVNEFESSVTVTSLTVMCFIMSMSVSSVVSTSVVIPAYGERRVVAVSGALFAACSIGYFLAPNIVVFIAFSAVKGICVGMIFVPSVSLISHYFNRRRSIATTICNGGVCVASIVSPPIIRAITTEFSMRGTFLILAAIELNLVAAGLLMRPVASYLKVSREDTGLTTLSDDQSASTKNTAQTTEADNGSAPLGHLVPSPVSAEHINKTAVHTDQPVLKNGSCYDPPASRASGALVANEIPELLETEEPLLPDPKKELTPRKGSVGQDSFHDSSWSVSHRDLSLHHVSMLSVTSGLEPAVTGVGLQGQLSGPVHERGWRSCCCISIIRRIFDPLLFRQWAYRLLLVSCVPSATTQYLLQYIPTIAVIKGATKDQAATLLTIIGSVDLVSRLAVGFLADTHILTATQLVAIFQICLGVLCQFNPLFDTFEKMIAMVVFMGMFIGTRQSLIAMTHIEIVGMEKMARCLSVSAMVATISAASHSPMLSAIMEASGSYNIVLHYVGVALVVGAVMMLCIPLLTAIDNKRQAKLTEV